MLKMNVVEVLQGMLQSEMKVFTIPLMAVQFLCAILPQVSEAIPDHPGVRKVISILSSTLAAISAIWIGFQAKKRYRECS